MLACAEGINKWSGESVDVWCAALEQILTSTNPGNAGTGERGVACGDSDQFASIMVQPALDEPVVTV